MQKSKAAAKGDRKAQATAVGDDSTVEAEARHRCRSRQGAENRWIQIRDSFLDRSVAEQIQVIRTGVRARILVVLAEAMQVSQETVFRAVGVPLTTAKRKLSKDENLDPVATERLIRICRMEKLAEDVFADGRDAHQWLLTENLALGVTPLSMLVTDLGAQEVSRVLHAIAYGGAV